MRTLASLAVASTVLGATVVVTTLLSGCSTTQKAARASAVSATRTGQPPRTTAPYPASARWTPLGMAFAKPSTAFVYGLDRTRAVVFATTTGGRTWRMILSHHGVYAISMNALSARRLLVATQTPAGPASVWTTANGGKTWSQADLPGTTSSPCALGISMDFVTSSHGLIACMSFDGGPQQIRGFFGTTDGGRTWRPLENNFTSHPVGTMPSHGLAHHLRLSGVRHGWLGTTEMFCLGGPLATSDGGRNWHVDAILPQLTTRHFCRFSTPKFFGSTAMMTARTNRGDLVLESSSSGRRWRVTGHYPANAAIPPILTGRGRAWTYVQSSKTTYTAYATSDGGAMWKSYAMSGWHSVPAKVFFGSPSSGWAVTTLLRHGTPWVLHTSDGGASWKTPLRRGGLPGRSDQRVR